MTVLPLAGRVGDGDRIPRPRFLFTPEVLPMRVRSTGLVAFLSLSTAAFAQTESFAQKELAADPRAEGVEEVQATSAGEIPSDFVARGPLHRLLVPAKHELLGRLQRSGLVRAREDYGSFELVEVSLANAGDLAALLARGAQLADELTLTSFNGYLLDGADAAATAATRASIPLDLRAPTAPPAADERRLTLVQFR